MTPLRLAPGPVMLDVSGLVLTAEDRLRLRHPQTGGVILFARNFASREQVCELVHSIRGERAGLLVAVDQEGGRVQRFREGFVDLPPMRRLGTLWDSDRAAALAAAGAVGRVIAAELASCGVDLSFTPVLDVDHGPSTVIGDRAFHSDPVAIAELAGALVRGLVEGGMQGVGKHYPGHGHVAADSHTDVPVDDRPLHAIEACDLIPFARLVAKGLGGIMPAHVIYPQVDARTAGFSPVWLRDILRGKLGFDGMIFSDDLGMAGAADAGGVVDRAHAALAAGCDMVLLCNDPAGADRLLAEFDAPRDPDAVRRHQRMCRRPPGAGFAGVAQADVATIGRIV